MQGPNTQSDAEQQSDKQASGEVVNDQLDWLKMEPRIRKLIQDWEIEVKETKLRRAQRKLDVDIDALRQGNAANPAQLNADETLISVRVIDENIRKEQPAKLNYLTQSRRLAIFDNPTVPQEKKEQLEIAFTKGMTYSGFLRNILKVDDGASLHAWDAVEILFNKDKPLNCGVEHIGHENLIFARDSKDIQGQEFILRGLDITITKLKEFQAKHGFDSAVVQSIIDDDKAKTQQISKNIRIYKYFTKVDGIVNVGWCSLKEGESGGSAVNAWLKKPELLDLGRREMKTVTEMQPQTIVDPITGLPITSNVPTQKQIMVQPPEDFYPIEIELYSESEEQCITDQKGRAFFDNPSQEAQVALWSLFINGAVRASNVYASSTSPSPSGGAPRKMETSLEHGCMYDGPVNFFNTPYPDPSILRAADGLNVRKAQEMGQSASAVINRDDSRKTAEELKQASSEQMMMASVSIFQFSSFMRRVLSVAWYIVQSQALQNNIILLPMKVQIPATVPGMIPQMQTINDIETISQKYDIKPAGDTDVLRREEKMQRRFMLLPLIQPTAAYPAFLMDTISELLPEDAEKYNSILRQGLASMEQQMAAMASMLQEATTGPDGQILPQWKQFEGQLQQMFSMIPQQSKPTGTQEQKPANEQSNSSNKAAA